MCSDSHICSLVKNEAIEHHPSTAGGPQGSVNSQDPAGFTRGSQLQGDMRNRGEGRSLVPLPALPFEIRNGEKTGPSAQPLGAPLLPAQAVRGPEQSGVLDGA